MPAHGIYRPTPVAIEEHVILGDASDGRLLPLILAQILNQLTLGERKTLLGASHGNASALERFVIKCCKLDPS